MNHFNFKIQKLGWLLLMPLLISCEKYLDQKPDSSLAIPDRLRDLQAILDNETRNSNYPDAGDVASDYYFLEEGAWANLNESLRFNYIWNGDMPPVVNNWSLSYQRVFDANVVLEQLEQQEEDVKASSDWRRIKGEALFLRGWLFYHLTQIFTVPYQEASVSSSLGIPLRLSPDINEKSVRSSLSETYQRILDDLSASVVLLPSMPAVKIRPGRAAAYAALSRVYLMMRDYVQAEAYADSCLILYGTIMDYNQLDTQKTNAFEPLNDEVIYQARFYPTSLFNSTARVTDELYDAYDDNDLRKRLFYKTNTAGARGFYGDYTGSVTGSSFFGLATDEVLLTRAECRVRLDRVGDGIADLNRLLQNRWKRGQYEPLHIEKKQEILNLILKERQKELAFRGGIRWPDLRRLCFEPDHFIELHRSIGGNLYTLDAETLKRFSFLIPFEVIQQTGMQQN